MKKLGFLAMAAAGMLFAACSSDKDVADSGESPDILSEKGVGYMKVGLNLPTRSVSSTRAWGEATELVDGDDAGNEWAVEDATLLIFSGTAESTAKLVQVSTLLKTPWVNVNKSDVANEVTTKHEETVTLNTTAGNLFALAVINSAGIIEKGSTDNKIKIVKESDPTSMDEIDFSGTDVTIATLQARIAKSTSGVSKFYDATQKRIFMTNAVLSNVRGGTFNPGAYPGTDASVTDYHILAPINKSYIYETKAEADDASAKPATDIYVERAVAKVTMNVGSTITIDGPSVVTGTLTANFDGWVLANTNNTSYIVRQVPDYTANVYEWNFVNASTLGEKFRFVGLNPVDVEYGTELAGYRTYWAKDPNYDSDVTSGALYTPTLTDASVFKAAKDGSDKLIPQYCNENTFDVQRQAYKNTTTAVVKVTYKVGGTAVALYSVGVDRKTFYTKDDIKTLAANALMANSDFKTWLNEKKKGDAVKKIEATDITDITFSTKDAATGKVTVTGVKISKNKLNASFTEDYDVIGSVITATTINTAIGDIKEYTGGVSYYAIRIKHFGDDLTPWSGIKVNGLDPAESTIDKIYPKSETGSDAEKKAANNAYLGRYGMVRNNWYDITVTDIAKIGAATPSELELDGDHPDDELEEAFIKARINILSWAKRAQSWSLK